MIVDSCNAVVRCRQHAHDCVRDVRWSRDYVLPQREGELCSAVPHGRIKAPFILGEEDHVLRTCPSPFHLEFGSDSSHYSVHLSVLIASHQRFYLLYFLVLPLESIFRHSFSVHSLRYHFLPLNLITHSLSRPGSPPGKFPSGRRQNILPTNHKQTHAVSSTETSTPQGGHQVTHLSVVVRASASSIHDSTALTGYAKATIDTGLLHAYHAVLLATNSSLHFRTPFYSTSPVLQTATNVEAEAGTISLGTGNTIQFLKTHPVCTHGPKPP